VKDFSATANNLIDPFGNGIKRIVMSGIGMCGITTIQINFLLSIVFVQQFQYAQSSRANLKGLIFVSILLYFFFQFFPYPTFK